MRVGDYCTREVVVVEGGESARAAARLMREHHVGDVVLVERRQDQARPVGILTDRDLVVEVIAAELDPDQLTVADLVTEQAAVVHEDDSLFDALEVMRARGVRRLPVIDGGELVGIITADDIIALMAEMLSDLRVVISRQFERELERRP